jgi:hypothetical protein
VISKKQTQMDLAIARDRITKLEQALAEIREVWAGSEADFHIETAPEAYLQRLVKRCYTIAVEALR